MSLDSISVSVQFYFSLTQVLRFLIWKRNCCSSKILNQHCFNAHFPRNVKPCKQETPLCDARNIPPALHNCPGSVHWGGGGYSLSWSGGYLCSRLGTKDRRYQQKGPGTRDQGRDLGPEAMGYPLPSDN